MINRDTPGPERARCENCGLTFSEDQLAEIDDLWERISGGEIVPAGQCPTCGSLCHYDPMPCPPGTTFLDLVRWIEAVAPGSAEEALGELATLRTFTARVRGLLQDQRGETWTWIPAPSGADVVMELTAALDAAGFTATDAEPEPDVADLFPAGFEPCDECSALINTRNTSGISFDHLPSCSLHPDNQGGAR